MSKIRAGAPCWVELASADPNGAQDFYNQLLGWTYSEPTAELNNYQRAFKDETVVAGLMPLAPDMSASVWTLYFATDDADETARRIKDNGGVVLTDAFDVMDMGKMAIAQDPTGAVFGLWQAGTFSGNGLAPEAGQLTWDDLRSSNPQQARSFYSAIFDYRYDDIGAPIDYVTYAHADGEAPLGGIGEMMGSGPKPAPHWLCYFRVDDTEKAQQFVLDNGGQITESMMDTPFGRQAGAIDPWGAVFNIIDSVGVATY